MTGVKVPVYGSNGSRRPWAAPLGSATITANRRSLSHGEVCPVAGLIKATKAWALHQDFKRHFIAPLDQGAGWTITGAEVAAWLAPRLPEVERAHQERQALALIGQRVRLDDGRTGDVMDLEGEGEELRLVVIVLGYDAWQRVEPARVVQDLGQMPDETDEEDETA